MRENVLNQLNKKLEKAEKEGNQEKACKIRAKMLKWK
jgi:hypothetical protein